MPEGQYTSQSDNRHQGGNAKCASKGTAWNAKARRDTRFPRGHFRHSSPQHCARARDWRQFGIKRFSLSARQFGQGAFELGGLVPALRASLKMGTGSGGPSSKFAIGGQNEFFLGKVMFATLHHRTPESARINLAIDLVRYAETLPKETPRIAAISR